MLQFPVHGKGPKTTWSMPSLTSILHGATRLVGAIGNPLFKASRLLQGKFLTLLLCSKLAYTLALGMESHSTGLQAPTLALKILFVEPLYRVYIGDALSCFTLP